MIRIATLNPQVHSLSIRQIDQLSTHLAQEKIDILCCQEKKTDSRAAYTSALAQNLDMSYTTSNLTHSDKEKKEKKETTCLSILTGKNVWMLNSGSLTVNEESGNFKRAQFGVIRSNGESLLILNAHFTDSGSALKKQFQALFSLPILSEQFGAVFFNTNTSADAQKTKETVEKQHFKIHRAACTEDIGDCPAVLTMKDQPPAAVKLCVSENIALPLTELADEKDMDTSLSLLGNITSLEIERLPKQHRQKRYSPLSFRERWLGSRDGDRAFAF